MVQETAYRPVSATSAARWWRGITAMDVVMGVELFILAITYSKLYSFFPQFRSALNWSAALIPLAFIPVALAWRPIAAIFSIAALLFLLGYQAMFASMWGTAFTGSMLGTYQGLLLAAMIGVHARGASPARFMAILFCAVFAYILLYLFLYSTVNEQEIIRIQMQGGGDFAQSIRRTHESKLGDMAESEYKVGTSGAVTAMVVLYALALARFKRVGRWKLAAPALLGVALYALWISDSRFNTLATLIACAAMLVPGGNHLKARAALAIAVVGTLIYVVAAFASYNLFDFLAGDVSGATRAREFNTANPVFLDTPILGVGIKNEAEDYRSVFTGTVAMADLGYYGDMLQIGLVGMVVLLACHAAMVQFVGKLVRAGVDKVTVSTVSCYIVYLACVQFITPQLSAGAGAVILSLSLAYVGSRVGVPASRRLTYAGDVAQPLPGEPAPS